MPQTYTFHIHGTHCSACVALSESTLKEFPGVVAAKTFLKQERVEVTGEFGDRTETEVMQALCATLKPYGYTLSHEAQQQTIHWEEFAYAVPAAFIFIAVFVLLQKLGIVNLINTAKVTYGTAFIVGLVASVSTCMALVGGIVLSFSASFAKAGDARKPQALFHIGRLVSFFVLGGVIGVLGSVFRLGAGSTLILGLVIAFVLLVLGLNLLDVTPWTKNLTLALPSGFGARIHRLKAANHTLTPLLIGVVTFFLPCGFTQSMQIYTLTTGSFWTGGLTMLAFALGTLPVLSLLSFSSLGIQKKTQSGVFFKAAGLIVIFFGLFNLMNTLVGAGVINPLFSF